MDSTRLPVRDWIKQYKGQFKRWEKYCKENDWRKSPDKHGEYDIQKDICKMVLNRLSYFLKKFESYIKYGYVKDFIKVMQVPITLFIERYNEYVDTVDWTTFGSQELRKIEMTFQADMMSDFNSIKDKLQEMNLDNEVVTFDIPIHSDKKIPLLMRSLMEDRYPHINEFKKVLESTHEIDMLGDDDYVKLLSSKEMFINQKNPPVYDTSKHYFEQKPGVLEYYENERLKFTEGITIAGIFIHPWLYWHINFFKTDLPMSVFKGTPLYDPTEIIKIHQPPLRDNEWFFAQMYEKAEKSSKGLFVFGTRRFAKTTIEASILSWIVTKTKNAECLVIGGDEADLQKLSQSLEIAFSNVNGAFRLPRNNNDWSHKIQFGLKEKSGETIPYANIYIRNVNAGKNRSSEKTAGASPSAWICDEGGKFALKAMFQAAIPSFQTPDGWRLVPIIVGTGGNKELSADAQQMLNNPEANDILPMDWDLLEKYIEEKDLITWKRKDFGVFVPGQMSYKTGIKKRKIDLSEYMGVENKFLKGIKIQVTDWKQAKLVMDADRARKKKDKQVLNKEKMYYPFDPLECFLSRLDNPFPAHEAQRHKEYLQSSGDTGLRVDFIKTRQGGYKHEFSDNELAEFPFDGGNINAPILMFEPPPDDNTNDGTYVAGLDHYKHDKASTDSVGSLIVFKRNVNLDEWCGRVVASYAARPDSIDTFNRNCEVILEAYGAECLQENADISFQQHLRRKHKDIILLANGEELARKFINTKATQNNKYGLNPNVKNQQYILNLVISYCQEEVEIGEDEDGNTIKVKGVTRINDVELLNELINFRYVGNYDRIISFGHALAWARYLDSLNIMPKVKRKNRPERRKAKKQAVNNTYSMTRFSPY